MAPDENKFWFPAKHCGWGWGIANTWQGLLVQGGYIAFTIFSAKALLPRGLNALFWILFLAATLLVVLIHMLKGEKS